MASSDQLKALIKSHISRDDGQFLSVAMQVAAHEAKLGHVKLAEELRDLIDAAKSRISQDPSGKLVAIGSAAKPKGELANLLTVSHPANRLGDMVLEDVASTQLHRVIKEQRQLARIKEHGLSPRRKLLLVGPPGTGKTMTAAALAGELGIPLFLVRLDSLITKFMGETAAKLRQVFDAVTDIRGVYFFDEFDAIGSQRSMANDVGEIRRVLNSFLQMIEGRERMQTAINVAQREVGVARRNLDEAQAEAEAGVERDSAYRPPTLGQGLSAPEYQAMIDGMLSWKDRYYAALNELEAREMKLAEEFVTAAKASKLQMRIKFLVRKTSPVEVQGATWIDGGKEFKPVSPIYVAAALVDHSRLQEILVGEQASRLRLQVIKNEHYKSLPIECGEKIPTGCELKKEAS